MTVVAMTAPHLRPANARPAQRYRADGQWHTRDYDELHRLVAGLAAGLAEWGVEPGDRIALRLRTRADWTVIDLAVARLGAVLVPLYPTGTPDQVAAAVALTRPRVLIEEGDVRAGPPPAPPAAGADPVRLLIGRTDGELGELATLVAAPGDPAARVRDEDLYTIAFTSGSTGAAKGCPLTHGNYAAVLRMALAAEHDPERGHAHRATTFVYLPLAHASARLQQLTTLAAGGEIAYGSGGTDAILRQLREVRPTYLPGVPRLFEQALVRSGGGAALRALLGGALHYALSGGAPIAPAVTAAFAAAGVPLVEGYGLTETSTAVTISAPHRMRAGSVGPALPGVDIRIAADGEILVRGPNVFAGYLGAHETETLRDGWFHTGDLGSLDADGFLHLTGRKKNLLVTASGKNIAPEPWENAIRQVAGVGAAVLVGDGRPYLTSVVAPDEAAGPEPAELVATARALNRRLAPPERVKKIILLDRPLSLARGELTASHKVVRTVVGRNLATLIDSAYGARPAPGVLPIEPQPE